MFGLFKKDRKGNGDPISKVAAHLKVMGYDLTPYGAAVALLELESGYREVEAASHIAFTTMALDIKTSGSDIGKLVRFVPHAKALLEVLREYREKGMINPTQWRNDVTAIHRITTIDEQQEIWIDKILSDPIAGKERLANSRITYGHSSED